MALQFTVRSRSRVAILAHNLGSPDILAFPLGLRSCRQIRRPLSSTSARFQQRSKYKESFGSRLRKALRETKIQWYQIPVGLGIGFLGLLQFYKVSEREKARIAEEAQDGEKQTRPKKRERIRPTGPWYCFSRCQYV